MKMSFRLLRFITYITILVSGLFSLLFLSSCSDFVSGYVYDRKESSDNYMYISLESRNSIFVSRTITADTVDFTDTSKNYCFYIWGTSVLGSISPRLVDFNVETGDTGTIELDFPVTSYYFTLAVTEGFASTPTNTSSILNEAIFVGYSNADLTYTNTVKFALSDTNLTGVGAINIGIILDSSWTAAEIAELNENYYVTFGLYYIKSGELLDGYSAINIEGALNNTSPVNTAGYYDGVQAGIYNFTINIQRQTGGNIYSYSDRIIVAANRTINSTICLPNIVERAPVAPQNFRAAYSMAPCIYYTYNGDTGISTRLKNDDSELDIDDYDVNGYGLLFAWDDASNNETGFKITLADLRKIKNTELSLKDAIENLPDEMDDETWKSLVGSYEGYSNYVTVLDEKFQSSSMYVAGSLERNCTSLILYVPFGSCYIAKIQSVNDAGESNACYVKLDQDFTVIDENDTDYTVGARYEGNAFSTLANRSKVINRYKIVYYLCGGKFEYKYNGDIFLTPENRDYVVTYHTYGAGSVLCPTVSLDESSVNNQALVYLGFDAPAENDPYYSNWKEWFDNNLGYSLGDRWRRWTVGSINGTNLIDILGGTTIVIDENYSYQKPNDYTGYTSLYLFARYD